MLNNKKYNPVVTELFIRDRKLNISLVFITQPFTQSYYEGRKQVEALKVLKPVEYQQKPKSNEGIFQNDLEKIKREFNEIKRLEEKK